MIKRYNFIASLHFKYVVNIVKQFAYSLKKNKYLKKNKMATENLKSFLEKIKGITLFKRIFKWGETLKDLIIVVSEFEDIQRITNKLAPRS